MQFLRSVGSSLHSINRPITAGTYPGTERFEVCYFVRRLVCFRINQSFLFSPKPDLFQSGYGSINEYYLREYLDLALV